jgi:hypothetical protein
MSNGIFLVYFFIVVRNRRVYRKEEKKRERERDNEFKERERKGQDMTHPPRTYIY